MVDVNGTLATCIGDPNLKLLVGVDRSELCLEKGELILDGVIIELVPGLETSGIRFQIIIHLIN